MKLPIYYYNGKNVKWIIFFNYRLSAKTDKMLTFSDRHFNKKYLKIFGFNVKLEKIKI